MTDFEILARLRGEMFAALQAFDGDCLVELLSLIQDLNTVATQIMEDVAYGKEQAKNEKRAKA